jgi:hypothetical protein
MVIIEFTSTADSKELRDNDKARDLQAVGTRDADSRQHGQFFEATEISFW